MKESECTDNNVYTNNNVVAKNSREFERSTSRTFMRLNTYAYKEAIQSTQRVVVRIWSVLCEQNSRDFKIAVVKVYQTVVSA